MDKTAFLASLKPRVQSREVPEAGGTFSFQEFSGAARDALTQMARGSATLSAYEAQLVIESLVQDDGAGNFVPVFSAEDAEAVSAMRSPSLSALAAAAMDVNRIGAKAEEAAAKN